jgi:ABC-type transporter Mla subunit MlaD
MEAAPIRAIIPWLLGLACVACLIVYMVSRGGQSHRLWVNVKDATGVLAGEPIREAGVNVGEVASVQPIDGGQRARIALDIGATAWPIRSGEAFRLRWGGTVSYLQQYVDLLQRHPAGTPYLPGATLPESSFDVPVAFDRLINDFTPLVRSGLRSALIKGGPAFAAAQPGLKGTLNRAPAAVAQASALLGDLDRSRSQLQLLISATGRVVGAFNTAQPTVEQLVSGAGRTFSAVSARAAALQATLSKAPGTFTRVDDTLTRANRTLQLAGQVTVALSPGVAELRKTVQPLDRLLTTLTTVGPDARATLTTVGRSAPQITRLLTKATQLMPTIGALTKGAIPELGCIRPYTPDMVSLFTNWTGFISATDGTDYYARVNPAELAWAPTNMQTETPGQAARLFPGLTDSFPRAPGEAAGQPWFQPQCGVTPASLTPAYDPEGGNTATAPLPVSAVKGLAP